jgi:hypothetical protein
VFGSKDVNLFPLDNLILYIDVDILPNSAFIEEPWDPLDIDVVNVPKSAIIEGS